MICACNCKITEYFIAAQIPPSLAATEPPLPTSPSQRPLQTHADSPPPARGQRSSPSLPPARPPAVRGRPLSRQTIVSAETIPANRLPKHLVGGRVGGAPWQAGGAERGGGDALRRLLSPGGGDALRRLLSPVPPPRRRRRVARQRRARPSPTPPPCRRERPLPPRPPLCYVHLHAVEGGGERVGQRAAAPGCYPPVIGHRAAGHAAPPPPACVGASLVPPPRHRHRRWPPPWPSRRGRCGLGRPTRRSDSRGVRVARSRRGQWLRAAQPPRRRCRRHRRRRRRRRCARHGESSGVSTDTAAAAAGGHHPPRDTADRVHACRTGGTPFTAVAARAYHPTVRSRFVGWRLGIRRRRGLSRMWRLRLEYRPSGAATWPDAAAAVPLVPLSRCRRPRHRVREPRRRIAVPTAVTAAAAAVTTALGWKRRRGGGGGGGGGVDLWGGTDAVEGRHPPAYQSVPLGPFPVPPAILSLPSSVAVLPRSFLAPLPPSLCAPLQRRSLGGGRGGAPAGWPQGRCRSQGGTLPQRPPRYFAPPRAVGSRTPAAADTSVAVAGHAVGGPVVGIEGVRVLSARGLPPAATRSPPTAAPSATTPLSPWWNPPTVGWLSWRLTPGRWAGWESVRGLRGRRRHRCQRSSRGRQRQVGGGGRTGDGSICSVSKAVAYPPP